MSETIINSNQVRASGDTSTETLINENQVRQAGDTSSETLINPNQIAGGGGDIPAQYTVVDWISTPTLSGNSVRLYIDTGISPSITDITYFKITYNMSNPVTYDTSQIGAPFGAEASSGAGLALVSYRDTSTGQGIFYSSSKAGGMVQDTKMTAELKNNTFTTTAGTTVSDIVYNSGTYRGTITIFAVRGTTVSYQAIMKLYEFKLGKSENELVRDYVPVYDTVTQKYGLYDKVSQAFFGNQLSSGYDFIGGND